MVAIVSPLGDADEQRAAIGVGEGGQRGGQGTGALLARLELQRLALVVFFDEADYLTRVDASALPSSYDTLSLSSIGPPL